MKAATKLRRRWAKLLAIGLCTAALSSWLFFDDYRATVAAAQNESGAKDAAASQAAFLEAYKVFMHPRCMNCHPNGDRPLQGDESREHFINVQRGADGKGKYALRCKNCHQDNNLSGENMPPGNPNWHLPPADMPMVFEGRSPRELALQMVDPKQNGGKTLEDLLHHVTQDSLVLWGWAPGDGRIKPPLTHEEFSRQMRTWIENGAVAPQ